MLKRVGLTKAVELVQVLDLVDEETGMLPIFVMQQLEVETHLSQ